MLIRYKELTAERLKKLKAVNIPSNTYRNQSSSLIQNEMQKFLRNLNNISYEELNNQELD